MSYVLRNCALWISQWVDPGTEVILDTSALTEQEWIAVVHNDPDAPPKDTVLVVIHPSRHRDLEDSVANMNPLSFDNFADVNGRHVAAYLIEKHCQDDPELRRRLRWGGIQ